MNRNKKKSSGGIIFSTDPDFVQEEFDSAPEISLKPSEQTARILLDRKQRGGKTVTLIEGLKMSNEDLDNLSRQLKSFCGVGGSSKAGEIIIQGDQRDKIVQWFQKNGYTKVRKL